MRLNHALSENYFILLCIDNILLRIPLDHHETVSTITESTERICITHLMI